MDNPETTSRNVIDKAASSASQALDATRSATNAALDTASSKVESLRSTLSPAIEGSLDSLVTYTKNKPIQALAAAVCTGAVLTMILRR